MKSITLLLFITLHLPHLSNPTQAQPPDAQTFTQPELRQELLSRVKRDQEIRNELIKSGVANPDPKIVERMQEIDNDNLKWLKEVIAKHKWPTIAMVGRDGVQATFLMTQHAELEFQAQVLPMVEASYKQNELAGQSYAMLVDRVRVRQGKPQLYGTQAKAVDQWQNQEPVFEPIEDEANVDERRKSVGLFTMKDYAKLLKQVYFPESGINNQPD